MKNLFNYVAICAILFGVVSCTEDRSDDLRGIPFYQRYMVEFTAQTTNVYAHFSKYKDETFQEIQLTGEQNIKVNNENMEYHMLSDDWNILYSYSRSLGNATDVTFTFTRDRGQVYQNSVSKSVIATIALPTDLTVVSQNQWIQWLGDAATSDGEVSALLSKQTENGAVSYSAEVNKETSQFRFVESEDPIKPGEYTLIVNRYKQVPTIQNDKTGAGAQGVINIYYKDSKQVTLR